MRALVAALDAAAALRELVRRSEPRLAAIALAAEMSGADAVRLSANEALRPVSEGDLYDVRRVVRQLELRLAPTPSLLKLALELRPDRVVLASEPTQSRLDAAPLDSAALRHALPPAARALREAGIPVWVRIAPEPESVKLARGAEIAGVELSSVGTVDLPESERAAALERFGDAARLAAKLRLPIGVAGRLEAGRVRGLVLAAPILERVVVGRALLARALLVGIERALRELRAELA
ncbi:MAG: pdxJ [Deltaproteobacteria bacterium]|nr:pdxJ [Deltaproteobacteria bacterium]